jgi:hypothetical protein
LITSSTYSSKQKPEIVGLHKKPKRSYEKSKQASRYPLQQQQQQQYWKQMHNKNKLKLLL